MMPDPSALADLLDLGSSTLAESGAARMSSRVSAVWNGASLVGPALTVTCTPGDNLAIHAALADAPAGVVLCVDVGDAHDVAYWGEVMTTAAEARGVAGLVIDGDVRDIDALEAHGFAVFSTGISLPGASKQMPGTVGGTASVGDIDVQTDDVVVGDRDGVVVVPADVIEAVRSAGARRRAKEALLVAALRDGATTVELLGLDISSIERSSGAAADRTTAPGRPADRRVR